MAAPVLPISKSSAARATDASAFAGLTEWSSWSLQISLTLVILGIIWQLIGSEAETLAEHRVRLFLLNIGIVWSIGSWLIDTGIPKSAKWTVFAVSALICAALAVHSSREFESALRVFQTPRINGQRIVHEAIGLSYARPSDFQLNLKPSMMRKLNSHPGSGSNPARRLLYGEVVMLNQLTKPAPAGHSPTTINVIVGHELNLGLNGVVTEVKQIQSLFASSPHNRITRPVHLSRLGPYQTIEFEVVRSDGPTKSRYIFFRSGEYLINFAFSSDDDKEFPSFDEFLRTVRLNEAG